MFSFGNVIFFNHPATFGIASPSGFSFGASSFGTPAASTQQGTGLFGQPATAAPQNNVFGNSVFGGTSMAPNGTTVKFNPPVATDSIQKNGQKTQVNTKHVCITAMKEYQDKCLEVYCYVWTQLFPRNFVLKIIYKTERVGPLSVVLVCSGQPLQPSLWALELQRLQQLRFLVRQPQQRSHLYSALLVIQEHLYLVRHSQWILLDKTHKVVYLAANLCSVVQTPLPQHSILVNSNPPKQVSVLANPLKVGRWPFTNIYFVRFHLWR